MGEPHIRRYTPRRLKGGGRSMVRAKRETREGANFKYPPLLLYLRQTQKANQFF